MILLEKKRFIFRKKISSKKSCAAQKFLKNICNSDFDFKSCEKLLSENLIHNLL